MGSAKPSIGSELGGKKRIHTDESGTQASITHVPAVDSDIGHLRSANLALNSRNGRAGEGIGKTVSLHDSKGADNRQQCTKASQSNGEDKYALEMHVSSKRRKKYN